MEQLEIEAKKRTELGKRAKKVRLYGSIAGVVCGKGMESIAIELNKKSFLKAISGHAGTNVIIKLKIADNGSSKVIPVLTHEIDRDPLSDDIFNVEFLRVVMTEKIKTKVIVELVGNPIGVKDKGGVLVHGLRELEIKCLPADIPDKIEVDVSGLDIGHSIPVSEIKTSKDLEVLSSLEEMVAMVSAATKEEVAAPAAAEAVPVEGAAAAVPGAEGAVSAAAPAGKAAAPAAAVPAAGQKAAPKKEEAPKK